MGPILLFNSLLPFIRSDRLYREYDHRPLFKKLYDFAISLFRELHFVSSIPYLEYLSAFLLNHPIKKVDWSHKSDTLFVLVHGLRGHPSVWEAHVNLIKTHPKFDVFAPFVPFQGNCSLEEAATPILPNILAYTKTHPGNPICLLGVSNGSRIVTWLETELREKAPTTAVKVSTIAGVHFGSSVITLLEQFGFGRLLFHPAILQELAYGSRKAKELMEKVQKPLPPEVADRDYEFYAATADMHVPNIDSSLPILNRGEHFHLIHGHGHNSIVAAIAKQQIDSCLKWINAVTRH